MIRTAGRLPVAALASGLLLILVASAGAQGQPLLYTVPFRAGDGKYLIYRIPALWTASGKPLLAFAEGRVTKRRATGNIDIVLRRSFDLGQTWEPMQVLADFGADFCGNPCVVQDPTTGRLWLAFTRTRGSDVEDDIVSGKAPPTQVWIMHSDDDGATWSRPRDLSASGRKPSWGWYGTGPGLGLYLGTGKKGRLLIPAYHTERGVYRAHCLFSDDHGMTWQLGADVADNTSEPQVVVLADRSLLMNARTTSGADEKRTLRISRDEGRTWKPATGMAALPENGCQGCIYRPIRSGIPNRFDLLFTHPTSRKRTDVQVWLSEDDGKTWPHAQKLWSGPSAYTALIQTPDGMVCALIECGRRGLYEQITFVKFAPEWVKARRAPR